MPLIKVMSNTYFLADNLKMVHWNTSGPIWTHIYRVSLPSMHCSVKTQWETLVSCTQMRVISLIDVLPPHIYISLFLFSLITKCHVSYLKCPWQKHSNLLTHWMIKLIHPRPPVHCSLPAVCALPPLPFFFFFFSFPSLLLFLASCSRFLEIWLLASLPLWLGLVEDKAKGFRLFPLGLDRWGWSLGTEEEESSSGSSSRDCELPGNWDSSDVVEGVRYKEIRGGSKKNINIQLWPFVSEYIWKVYILMFLEAYRD